MIYQSEPDEHGFGVEVHIGRGLPSFDIIGAPPERVRLVRDRLDEMFNANGKPWRARRVTVNVIGPRRTVGAVAFAIYDAINILDSQ